MKVLKAIIKVISGAFAVREEPQLGKLDFKTGKVTW